MKDRILNILKTPVVIIGALISLLLLYIKFLKNKNSTLEGQAEESATKSTDAVLEQQQSDLKTQNDSKIAAIEAEKGRKLTDQEMVDFLKTL